MHRMELRYPRKSNGMFYINKDQMDDIAAMMLGEYMPSVLEEAQPVDIDALAEDKLFLTIQHKSIGHGGGFLGLTAFEDVKDLPCLDDMFRPIKIDIPAGTVLIHSDLQGYQNRARRRFTVAHECSHWVLHRSYHSPTNQTYSFRTQRPPYIACRAANIERKRYEPKTDSDWEEWQADALASALLMPLRPFRALADRLVCKGGRRHLSDRVDGEYIECVEEVADTFTVSKTAAEIRLKQLGYIREA